MIVRLPFGHMVSFVEPGHVLARARAVSALGTFHVDDVEAADAPVSCTLGDSTWRTHDGKPYALLCGTGGDMEALAGRMRSNRSPFESAEISHFRSLVPANGTLRHPFEVLDEPRLLAAVSKGRRGMVRGLVSDREAAMAEAAANFRRKLVAIDGAVWAMRGEPRYEVALEDGVVSVSEETGERRSADWSVPFRADDREGALAFGRTLAKSGKGPSFRDATGSCRNGGAITLVDPAALVLDEADEMAARILDRMSPLFLHEPVASGDGSTTTRKTLRAAREAGTPGWGTSLMALPDLAGMVAANATGSNARERKRAARACSIIAEAWEAVRDTRARRLAVAETASDDPAIAAFVP